MKGTDWVRIHFQERPWDLVVAIGYTLVSVGVMIASAVGNPLGILLVLFVPGYVLVAALFPGNKELDWIERIALSLGLGIAIIPLLGLLLNFSPLGIRFAPIAVTLAAFTVGVGYAAYWRRMRLPVGRRLSATFSLPRPTWMGYSFIEKLLTIALITSVVVAAATLAYVILAPRPGDRFTEFFILGPSGNATGYPTKLNVSQPGNVILGIANYESTNVTYTIRVDLVGVRLAYNSTTGLNQTVEVNRTTWSWINVTCARGQRWSQPYTFSIRFVGLWKVQFLLFKNGDFSSPYRELRLYVRVS